MGEKTASPKVFLHPSAILRNARLPAAPGSASAVGYAVLLPTSRLRAFAITISFSRAALIAKFASSPSFGSFLHLYTRTAEEVNMLCLANTKGSPYVSNTAACAEYARVSRHHLDLAGGQCCSNL